MLNNAKLRQSTFVSQQMSQIKCIDEAEGIHSKSEYHRIFNLWRDYDYLTTMLAIIGLILCVGLNETNYFSHFKAVDREKFPDAMHDPRNRKALSNMIRVITVSTNIVALYCLVRRHQYKVLWRNKYFNEDGSTHIYYQF